MGVSVATLAGKRVTDARVDLPAWGCWHATASVDGDVELSGSVELVLADLTLRGTIVSGGPDAGRSHFRIVAGAGGWGKPIKASSYASDAGVKVATVLGDAAREAGETLAPIDSSERVGPGWTRREGPASWALEAIAPRRWYVDELGVTRLGRRPTAPLVGKVTHGPVDRARGTVTLASESIASLLPGLVVDGLEAVDVQHSISKDGLRSLVWGARSSTTSRRLAALQKIIEQLDPDRAFRGFAEYRVVTQEGDRLNLQPVRVSTGMPSLRRVPMRPGVAGAKSKVALGSNVLVAFIDADAARPFVAAFADAEGSGFTPLLTEIDASTFVRIGAGAKPVVAAGDLAGGIWPCVPTQVKVLV